jgi:hypothetical protein
MPARRRLSLRYDVEAARTALVARGAAVREVVHAAMPGAQFQPDGASGRIGGPAPGKASYRSCAMFGRPSG